MTDRLRVARPPVAELHVHLEGTLEPAFIIETAGENGIDLPWRSLEHLEAQYDFTDLQSFLDLLYVNLEVLRDADDFAAVTHRYLARASAAGVRHAEIFFDIQAHTRRGIPAETVIGGIRSALDRGLTDHGMTTKLIMSFWRDLPPGDAMDALAHVLDAGLPIDGIGLDSAEVGYPPSLFVEVYRMARDAGLHVVAHAGEEGPAEYVREALDLLHVERVDHGIRSLEDPDLVERLVRDRVPLTVCPLSNVRLRTVDTMADHPLPRMLELGLLVSVNSDDPAYFGGYLDANFDAVVTQFGLDAGAVEQLARNSVDSAFLDPVGRARLHGEIDAWKRDRSE
ncbi:adenosine deaminase [Agromyces aurantiacus]|uniref:Adenine deaminase n=1 Tax=Agromyces aurantiacus TaxID=165814 RepID=A0ABV9R210_9MICO|nr:adenosine deaminase [Agromyces aurantiacus]MBM7505798.1 adenosine deaminase [Agromyces aurantiacus]